MLYAPGDGSPSVERITLEREDRSSRFSSARRIPGEFWTVRTACANPSATADFCDEGNNNTSHGDNYMPGQM